MEKIKTAVRYIVKDVEKSISFYREHLGFTLEMHPAPGFAALSKGSLNLFLNEPGVGGAGQKMPDGTLPSPGGWNRIQLPVDDLEKQYQLFKKKGLEFRNEIVDGQGGKQVLLKDPSGNFIELFESNQNRKVNFIPEGYHSVTPFIATDNPKELIEFLESAFDAKINYRMKSDDGIIRHATVKIGDSLIMISNGTELYDPMPLMLHVFVEDADETYHRALKFGAKSLQEPHDEFYGDRRSGVVDKWGNTWWIATHKEDLDDEELKTREKEFREKMMHEK
jgi:uncharacterized glyoxalase superfamily protein PhnB